MCNACRFQSNLHIFPGIGKYLQSEECLFSHRSWTAEVCIPAKNNRAPSYEKIKTEKEREERGKKKKNSIDMMKIGSLTHDRKLLRMTRNRHWVTQTTLPASEARNSFFPIPHFCSSVPRLRLIQSSDIVGGCSRLIRDEEIEIWWEFWSLSFITHSLYCGIVKKKKSMIDL